MECHDAILNRDGTPEPKSRRGWISRNGKCSVMTREAAGVDCNEPWIASCDKHGEMLGCSTKAIAVKSCKHRDWCSGCRADVAAHITALHRELDEYAGD